MQAKSLRKLRGSCHCGTAQHYRITTASLPHHCFRKIYGIPSFSRPRTAPDNYNVNFRCLDDFDLQAEQPERPHIDGQSWEEAVENMRG